MIAVDGDSVAIHNWPEALGEARGMRVLKFAENCSTARQCAIRSWRVLSARPKWYALLLGQWSQNHEPLAEFERCIRIAIEVMLGHGVRVCLITPPTEVADLFPYRAVLHKLNTLYRIGLLDLYEHLQRAPIADDWFEVDGTVRCHFSKLGALKVVEFFNLPENTHLCAP